jgi:hypothetical protein
MTSTDGRADARNVATCHCISRRIRRCLGWLAIAVGHLLGEAVKDDGPRLTRLGGLVLLAALLYPLFVVTDRVFNVHPSWSDPGGPLRLAPIVLFTWLRGRRDRPGCRARSSRWSPGSTVACTWAVAAFLGFEAALGSALPPGARWVFVCGLVTVALGVTVRHVHARRALADASLRARR